jgi:YidC/Oxa1 family membrane protein insertase
MTQINLMGSPEGPDPKRLLIAVVATSAVLMLYSYFFAPKPENPQAKQELALQEEKLLKVPEAIKAPEMAHALATPDDIPSTFHSFDLPGDDNRSAYHASVSSKGAIINDFSLLDFSHKKVLLEGFEHKSFMMALASSEKDITLTEDSSYEVLFSDKSNINLRHISKEGFQVERNIHFLPSGKVEESIRLKNLSEKPIKATLRFSSKKTKVASDGGFFSPAIQGDSFVFKSKDKYERHSFADILNKPADVSDPLYIGFEEQFFLTALVPHYRDEIHETKLSVSEPKEKIREGSIDIKLKPIILMPSEEKTLAHEMFLGPKQVNLLAAFKPPLDENIDFGWFGVLSRPMLWLLVQIYDFVKNYGIAIILITLLIKLLTYPLTAKSFSSQQVMKELQPKIKALQEKYGHDRTLLGQKQMELYRSQGINPLAGCLPMLVQLPIWFAFFQMLRSSVELYDQPFYWWIKDLTHPDPYFVLPVLMGISMLIQQIVSPPPAEQPQMKYVMWAMPIFLTFIMLNMPSGLSLYILTNNLLTLLQQTIIKKRTVNITA